MNFKMDEDMYHDGDNFVYPWADKEKTRWHYAQKTMKILAPAITECDKDGATLYFFSEKPFKNYKNITNPDDFESLFEQNQPNGGTDLHGVLSVAIENHFHNYKKTKKPETILVLTDGQPDEEDSVYELIAKTSKKLDDSKQLSITFIQIGSSESAHYFLKQLDNNLKKWGAKHDIVDTQNQDELGHGGMDFEKLIKESLHG